MNMQLPVRIGDWMQTYTGRQFWPMDPRSEDICIEDIAHALGHLCRYGGHSATFYSVAQHSVLVSRALPEEYKLWGLLHDASEAYLVDVPRPLKKHLIGYREAEERVMAAVCQRFHISREMPAEVKRVDNAILVDEFKALMQPPPADLAFPEPGLGIFIARWSPSFARDTFLFEFELLMREREHV